VTSYRLSHAIWLAGFLALGALPSARAMPAPSDADHVLTVDAAPRLRLAQAQPLPSPSQTPDAAAPADQQAAPEEPIGNVATLTGVATVTRNDIDTPLKIKDDIYLNDVVKTQASSSLSITFSDATTFRLSANAEIIIDTYVYEAGGANNAGTFDITRGTVAFVAAQVAKTGEMQITTPSASLGIRGTTGVVEVPEGAAAATATNNVNIKLYPDADGRVGHIDINDRQGARLGALTQGASGFAIRPGAAGAAGAGMRFAAVPIAIAPQQQQRDLGFVRQVHTAQTTGRQIFTERQTFRRANPTVVNPNAPQRQFQPGRPGQQPGQNRPGQPGQNQPGQNQPGQNRPGQPGQPGTPNNRPGQQQPGQQGQPTRPGQTTPSTAPGQQGTPSRPGQTTPRQQGTPLRPGQTAPTTTPGQSGTPLRPGQTAPTTTPGQSGAPPRPGQIAPTTPGQSGLPPRPGQNVLPPGQPGLPPRPGPTTLPPGPGPGVPPQPYVRPGAPPPLPNGQPLLRQQPGPGRPQFAPPGAPRPGLPRPGKPAPPPKGKDKKQTR
jgi:FecR protein